MNAPRSFRMPAPRTIPAAVLPALLLLVLLLGACATYEPPAADEPAATLKLRYTYGRRVDGTRLHVSLQLQEGPQAETLTALADYAGPVVEGYPAPRIPEYSLRVRAVPGTVLVPRLTFARTTEVRVPNMTWYVRGTECCAYSWLVTEYHTRSVEHELACAAAVRFDPEPDAVYLVVYRNARVTEDCTARIFREREAGGGTPVLEPVGSGVPVP